MNCLKCQKLFVYRLATALVILAAVFFSARASQGAIAESIDATCRIALPDGSRGTGCVFEINHGLVYVLTAAHVVGESRTVDCVFWRQGHQSLPLPGRVAERAAQADAAVVVLAQSLFDGVLPTAIPLAPRDYVIRPGETLTSVGCANGAWSTGWKGHALRYEGDDLRFVPTPANGRSGSAIFDAEGRRILGIVCARTGDDAEGIATPVNVIYRAFDTATHDAGRPSPSGMKATGAGITPCVALTDGTSLSGGTLATDCGPGGCPTCPTPLLPRILPLRPRAESEKKTYPTLPEPRVDVKPLDDKLGRIAELLGEIKSERAKQPSGDGAASDAQARKIAQDAMQNAGQALEAAKAAQTEAAKIAQLTEGLATQVKEVAGQTSRLSAAQEKTAETIQKHGTLGERFDLLKQRVEEKVGDDASKPEKIRAFIHEAVTDKTEWLRLGLIAALALPLLIFVIDYAHHKKSGDPLLVEKMAAHLGAAATHQPFLAPAATVASHAAHDVTGLLALLNQQAQAQAQSQRPAAPATVVVAPAPAAPTTPVA